MKNSILCALVAILAISALFGMFLMVRKNYQDNKYVESIVRKRVEDQFAAFQKIDLDLHEETRSNKIVAKIGTDAWNLEEASGISA